VYYYIKKKGYRKERKMGETKRGTREEMLAQIRGEAGEEVYPTRHVDPEHDEHVREMRRRKEAANNRAIENARSEGETPEETAARHEREEARMREAEAAMAEDRRLYPDRYMSVPDRMQWRKEHPDIVASRG
jgi:hypothetical protein